MDAKLVVRRPACRVERGRGTRSPRSGSARRGALATLALVLRRTRLGRAGASAAIAVLIVGATDAGASVSPHGSALTTPPEALSAALSCPQGVAGDRDPVLLVPGPGGDPTFIYAAGLEPVLRARGYPVCGLYLPEAGFGDLQIQAEYVVASIREMAARSGRTVSVIGVSQGGLPPRWALKWWPDVRFLVGDLIGLAPASQGFPLGQAICAQPCPPATRQQIPGSRFLAALNQGDETPGGGRVAYSVISSQTDASIPPPFPDLKGESDDSNTQVQAICPGREVDHGHIQYDAVAVALVLDALGHDGPASASRVPGTECAKTYADGIDPEEVDRQFVAGLQFFFAHFGDAGLTEVEPALKPYVSGWRRSAWRP